MSEKHADEASLERLAETSRAVQRMTDANIKGTALVLTALLPCLQTLSNVPYVAVIGSLASLVPAPTRAMYCATKAAQQMLVQSVAAECVTQARVADRQLVRFVTLAPSSVSTSFRARMSVNDESNDNASVPRRACLSADRVGFAAVQCVDQGVVGVQPLPFRYFFVWLLAPLWYVSCIRLTQVPAYWSVAHIVATTTSVAYSGIQAAIYLRCVPANSSASLSASAFSPARGSFSSSASSVSSSSSSSSSSPSGSISSSSSSA